MLQEMNYVINVGIGKQNLLVQDGSIVRIGETLFTVHIDATGIDLLNNSTNKWVRIGEHFGNGEFQWGGLLCHVKEVVKF